MSLHERMRVLVIRFKMIGDVLLTSVVAQSLRASFPTAQIDCLTYSESAALFEYQSPYDNVVALTPEQRSNPFRYFSIVWSLSRHSYDVIIDAAGTTKSSFVSWLSPRALFRISRYKRGQGWAYTHQLNAEQLPENKLAERLALLQPLKQSGYAISDVTAPVINLKSQEKFDAKEKLEQAGVDLTKPVFGFAIGSRAAHKSWPQERIQKVLQEVLVKYDAQVILLAGLEHERQAASALRALFDRHAPIFTDVETHSLRELIAQISCCSLFVGNEGGPRHMAAAVGLPTVAVVSPSAAKAEWLGADTPNHIAIEWRDIDPKGHAETGSIDVTDPDYQRLYNLIKPSHVLDAISAVLSVPPPVKSRL